MTIFCKLRSLKLKATLHTSSPMRTELSFLHLCRSPSRLPLLHDSNEQWLADMTNTVSRTAILTIDCVRDDFVAIPAEVLLAKAIKKTSHNPECKF